MKCPNCRKDIVNGRVTLRSQYLSRAVFSPEGLIDGFPQKWLKGTFLDKGLRAGEVDLVSNYSGSASPPVRGATKCPNCGTVVIPP